MGAHIAERTIVSVAVAGNGQFQGCSKSSGAVAAIHPGFAGGRALSQMTDDELKAIARVRQLDGAGILAKEHLIPFVEIMEKYNPGSVGVVYEDHDPEVDLYEKPGES